MPDVALHELGLGRHPGWFAVAVGLPLQVIEDADVPAGGQRGIDDVRANQTGATGDQRRLAPPVNHLAALLPATLRHRRHHAVQSRGALGHNAASLLGLQARQSRRWPARRW